MHYFISEKIKKRDTFCHSSERNLAQRIVVDKRIRQQTIGSVLVKEFLDNFINKNFKL